MATIKQKKAIANVVENGGNISRAMLDADYSPATAKTPQKLTESKAWKEIMEEHLPDITLAKEHQELLNQKKLDYFVFPKRMDDEEIEGHVEAAGLTLIVTRETDKGKMAFYSIPDAQAKQKALDMAYKLKGSYAAEKTANVDIQIKGDVKDFERLEEVRLKYEEELRAKLISQ